MTNQDVHEKLMVHLSLMGMMYPPREGLLNILKANFNEEEAKVVLSIPTHKIPLQGTTLAEISKSSEIPFEDLHKILNNLVERGLLFSCKNQETGELSYALQQAGFGFPQTFFWKGEDTPHSKNMAKQVLRYFNTEVTKQTFGPEPIPFRFVPVDETIEPETQAVLPYQAMEQIIKSSNRIGVAHCICRHSMKLIGRDCGHPIEVCMKFNELADYLIERGFAREISVEEALVISRSASELGLVHFTDNAMDNIQQNCNCCGCSCWNLGRIRRRTIPRDEIIATYFIRETLSDKCVGCGRCIDICPAAAINLEEDLALVNNNWCIGCGVCKSKCRNDAIIIVSRKDIGDTLPEKDFKTLHTKILKSRSSRI